MAAPTTVACLRVRAAPSHAAAAPGRLAALLSAAELRPPGLAPGAVLCVRRLGDPAPGTLRVGAPALRVPEVWREGVVESLERALGAAARPGLGAVPAGAESVLFASRAELLAALAREWCGGTAHACWWWRSVAGDGPVAEAVARVWVAAAAAAPAALEALAREGRAAGFVARFDDVVAAAVAEAVAERFGLRAVVMGLRACEIAPSRVPDAGDVVPDVKVTPPQQAAPAAREDPREPVPRQATRAAVLAPAWAELVPEAAAPSLSPARRTLLALALVLRRRPAAARAAGFAVELRRWVLAPPPPPSARPAAPEPAGQAERRPAAALIAPLQDAPDLVVAPPLPATRRPRVAPLPPAAVTPARAAKASTPPRTVRAEASAAVPRPARLPAATHVLTAPAAGIGTRLGGVPMLINVALALGLYGDFTTPLRPGLRLDPWQFLALTARRLLGPRGFTRDPIWSLLGELAGDARFRPPRDWRLPTGWLTAFAADTRPWRVGERDGRLIVRHPAGFLVLDVPATAPRPLARYGDPPTTRVHAGAQARVPALERWLDRLVPYLRARLRLALGADPTRLLLPIPARLVVSDERLDVEIALADLPIEVRIAGLDRDPGWVPAAGREIAFHFA